MNKRKAKLVIDVEMFPNWFCLGVGLLEGGPRDHVLFIEAIGANNRLSDDDAARVERILRNRITIGFNSQSYDLPIMAAAIDRQPVRTLYEISSAIINRTDSILAKRYMKRAVVYENHIDTFKAISHMPVGLKMYGARLGFETIEDLPFDPDEEIQTVQQMLEVQAYNCNDLDLTAEFYHAVKENIRLKNELTKTLGVKLRTARFSQIAERVIDTKIRPSHDKSQITEKWKYQPPEFLKFETGLLKGLLVDIMDSEFQLDKSGIYRIRQSIRDRRILVGNLIYQIGVGGLHSVDGPTVYQQEGNKRILEYDVRSYYPSLIDVLQIRPLQYGADFNRLYRKIYDSRIRAVEQGDDSLAAQLKLVLNAFGGKLGSRHSILYSPAGFANMTMTGQLVLLMLIERLENVRGLEVISANTDSVTILTDNQNHESVLESWEKDTGFKLNETEYQSRFGRDVNNYCAVKMDGKWKSKGIFSNDRLTTTPNGRISVDAAMENLKSNRNIEDYIRFSLRTEHVTRSNVQDCVFARKVSGGAKWGDDLIGSTIRWVWAFGGLSKDIQYQGNGNTVSNGSASVPVMDFSDVTHLESITIDVDRYVQYAENIVESVQSKQTELALC